MEYEITPLEARELRERNAPFILLDVREIWERETAAIAGSAFIPMGEIPARIQELDPDGHIVVYCHHGVRSMNVAYWLRQQGYDKAQSMSGGIDRWSVEVDPTVARY